jgi:hypothetical protein
MNKRQEQKQLLLQMKKEILSLEDSIKQYKLMNIEIKTIKNLKITARCIQLFAPYIVSTGIIYGGFTLLGNSPLVNDKTYLNVMTEFDNEGNIRYESQYGSFDGEDVLYYYSSWTKDDDFYSRNIETYYLEDKTYEDLIDIFEYGDLKLKYTFGQPTSNIKETKNNITEEELEQQPYLKAIIYEEDKDNYIITDESFNKGFFMALVCGGINALINVIIVIIRPKISSFDFIECINRINEENRPIDLDALNKKIELKKENYDRLTR